MKKILFTLIVCLSSTLIVWSQAGFVKIVDATNPATTFLSPGIYKGAAWIDFDNDNDIDLFASPHRLFRNDGGGSFIEIPAPFGFVALQNPGGSSWADLNADGLIDCIIAQHPSGIYINNGNETFTNISSQIDSFNVFPSWGCAIGNWNNDAFPDFIFAHAANFHLAGPFPSKLYLNTNNAITPSYVTGYTLTDSVKPYTVPYWSDFDLDGDMDLFVASGPGGSAGPDFCYRNLKMETGLDTLERITNTLFSNQLQDGQCYNFIDFDNDQDLDLCLMNYSGAKSRFYQNDNNVYTELNFPFTTQLSNLTNNWGDFDNDGDLDVLITNDQQPTKYYINNGNGSFANAQNIGIAGACGIANGDFDNDGDLDLFIHGNGSSRAMFRNDTAANGNHWINIKCTGTISNNSAIGTIVKIKAVISGVPVWQMREINAQNSFQSQNDLRVHFGLGDATSIDSLIIKYPGATDQIFINIAPDIFYCHFEGNSSLCQVGLSNEELQPLKALNFYPNPVHDFLEIILTEKNSSFPIVVEVIASNGAVVYADEIMTSKEKFTIDLRKLSAGNYSVAVVINSQKYSAKFIKM